jgi:GNAT superfamily N-acetyltransferase
MRAVRVTARFARWLGTVAAIAAGLLALALYDDGWWVALAVLAAIPAIVLWFFSFALTEVAELPERLRGAPEEVARLGSTLDELRRARGTGVARALWRTGRRAASARDLATPWAPLLPLLSIPFLAATAVSALVVPLIVVAALVALAVAT